MSRHAYLSSIINLPSKIASQPEKRLSSCEIDRSIEWTKYSQAYHSLLYSKPSSNLLGTKGFLQSDGQKYNSKYKYNLNLEKLIKASLVSRPKLIWLPCIDERIQYLTASHHALSLGLPGCECLMSHSEKMKVVDELVSICQQNPTIEEIVVSSHSKCGAVEHSLKNTSHKNRLSTIWKAFLDKDRLLDAASEKYASTFANLLEQRLQNQASKVMVRTHHFQYQELHSKNLHHAFGAIINFNPLLNGAELEENLELPMFNIYAGNQADQTILDNIDLAVNIAANSTGFSCQYINQDNPFILLFTVSKKNLVQLNQIKTIIQKIQQKDYPLAIVYTVLGTD